MTRLFIPADAAAIAVGANRVASALAGELAKRGEAATIVRTGSRGNLTRSSQALAPASSSCWPYSALSVHRLIGSG